MNEIILNLDNSNPIQHTIFTNNIDSKIIVNNESKEIENVKEFFRNIIFNMFEKNQKQTIKISSKLENYENKEVVNIILDMVKICNDVEIEDSTDI